MTDKRERAMEIIKQMLDPEVAALMGKAEGDAGFASEIGSLAMENVFENLWTRPGLGVRDRSLVTLGILIALRAEGELRFHFPAALRNGVTRDELAEVIYHASGYAGFPAAATARTVAVEVLPKE